jgi:CTP:molybdopterin cytidylyltransferase MocA
MSTLRLLLQLAVDEGNKVCQPAHAGKPRHPVVLPKGIFEQLAESPAGNLKEFLQNQKVVLFESDDAGLDLDIDRPEDYVRALSLGNS